MMNSYKMHTVPYIRFSYLFIFMYVFLYVKHKEAEMKGKTVTRKQWEAE